jgi:magnesium transporter
MITYCKPDHPELIIEKTGQKLYDRQLGSRHACFPVGGTGYFLAFCWTDVTHIKKRDSRVSIYCDNSQLIMMGTEEVTAVMQSLPQDGDPFATLVEFFSELTGPDVDVLERQERDINELEVGLLTTEHPSKGALRRIITLRRALMKTKRYYEQLGMVVDRLTENEARIIDEEIHGRYRAVGRYVHYLIQYVVDLREFVTQVREAYQSQIDIDQNEIMKIFTVLTAIFMPLTLIVGWYGMNFNIPELSWAHGYLYVTVLSLVVCSICFFIFKKKHWF